MKKNVKRWSRVPATHHVDYYLTWITPEGDLMDMCSIWEDEHHNWYFGSSVTGEDKFLDDTGYLYKAKRRAEYEIDKFFKDTAEYYLEMARSFNGSWEATEGKYEPRRRERSTC